VSIEICEHIQEDMDQLLASLTEKGRGTAYRQLSALQERWQTWLARIEYYGDYTLSGSAGEEDRRLRAWHDTNRYLTLHETKLFKAICAFQELVHEQALYDAQPALVDGMLNSIDLELSKLEIRQFKKLQTLQKTKRAELETLENQIQEKKRKEKIFESRIFSTAVKKIPDGKMKCPHLYYFLIDRESKIHFTAAETHALHAKIGGSVLDLFGTAMNRITRGILPLFDIAVSIFEGLKEFISTIPIISTILMGVPALVSIIKSWAKDQSSKKKVLSAIALGLFMASLFVAVMLTGLSTVVAVGIAGSAFTAAIITVGLVANYLIPLYKLHHRMNALSSLKATLESIQANPPSQEIKTLCDTDKHILLKAIEKTWLAYNSHERENPRYQEPLKQIKELILAGTQITDIRENMHMQEVLRGTTLETFLHEQRNEQITYLETELNTLHTERTRLTVLAVNTAFNVLGFILVCIPIPPVQAVGAGLIIASMAIALIVKYDVLSKIENAFRELFSHKPPTEHTGDPPKQAEIHALLNTDNPQGKPSEPTTQKTIQPPVSPTPSLAQTQHHLLAPTPPTNTAREPDTATESKKNTKEG